MPGEFESMWNAANAASVRQLIRGMSRKESQRRTKNAVRLSWISICVYAASRIALVMIYSQQNIN